MSENVAVGIIGTGRHGARYARHIVDDVAGLNLVAVSRRSAIGAQQAAEWGVRYYSDWVEMVHDPAVEAVIAVATPDLNEGIGRECIKVGKPLLVEKPLAVDAQVASCMVEAFAEAGLELTVGQTLRYNSIILALRRELPRLGKLYSFAASQRLEPTLHDWLDDPEVAGGGVFLHTAVHMFDALRFITGREVQRVRATMFSRHNGQVEDLVTAQVEMAGGLVGVVDASKVGLARSGRYEFVGDNGQLQGDQVHDLLQFVQGMNVEDLARPQPTSAIVPLLRDWHAMLTKGAANPIPGAAGLAAVRISDACRRSALVGDWVEVG